MGIGQLGDAGKVATGKVYRPKALKLFSGKIALQILAARNFTPLTSTVGGLFASLPSRPARLVIHPYGPTIVQIIARTLQ